jgi:ribonuclease HI
MNHYDIYCDGLTEPINPGGVSTYGWAAFCNGTFLAMSKGYLDEGEGTTANIASYMAIIKALAWVWNDNHKEENICIISDSKLAIYQLTGEWKVNAENLQHYYDWAKRGLAPLSSCTLQWAQKGSKQTMAERLSRAAYDEHVKSHGKECVGHGKRPRYMKKAQDE